MSTAFSCTTCRVAFPNADSQKIHWKSDWHHYNLKRKVASLPPLSADIFAEKILSIQKHNEAVQKKAEFYRECTYCSKNFYSEGAYSSHLASKKHHENVRKFEMKSRTDQLRHDETSSVTSSTLSMGEPVDESAEEEELQNLTKRLASESVSVSDSSLKNGAMSTETSQAKTTAEPTGEDFEKELARRVSEKLSLRDCLFCNASFSSFEANKKHMKAIHSLYIPEREYVVDEPGLFEYLAEKVSIGYTCLTCNRQFKSLEAVRSHMQQKGHFSIAYDTDEEQLELADYYDFTTSYPDYEKPHEVVDAENAENDENWEDASSDSDSSVDSLDVGRVPIAEEYELHLPTGARAGHRSLSRYFRQNIRPSTTNAVGDGAAVHQNVARHAMSGEALARNRAVETSLAGVRDGRKNYSASHIKTFQDRRKKEAFFTKIAYKNNTKQHYRDPLLQ
ncbi:ribosome biogenesis protein [Schizosaccharomyces cryophilus OY26]|uniref:Ribosome biogenesis protein n=1 Tax=Schizosaccharomyces cryophilus (strain OY26 / ATCC MYA-4695 / CBS 11777 / NBRC 106824 / NRRL Y48691) TaxID=653667 RepID=S9VX80_SCHCR|nr:ribosome biogenesis protein [Schizosaccharomyces cryophilus OY26]EPY50605.1 ribosome biogenesis protein [Schizosaccharomyces cryophilus OY26]